MVSVLSGIANMSQNQENITKRVQDAHAVCAKPKRSRLTLESGAVVFVPAVFAKSRRLRLESGEVVFVPAAAEAEVTRSLKLAAPAEPVQAAPPPPPPAQATVTEPAVVKECDYNSDSDSDDDGAPSFSQLEFEDKLRDAVRQANIKRFRNLLKQQRCTGKQLPLWVLHTSVEQWVRTDASKYLKVLRDDLAHCEPIHMLMIIIEVVMSYKNWEGYLEHYTIGNAEWDRETSFEDEFSDEEGIDELEILNESDGERYETAMQCADTFGAFDNVLPLLVLAAKRRFPSHDARATGRDVEMQLQAYLDKNLDSPKLPRLGDPKAFGDLRRVEIDGVLSGLQLKNGTVAKSFLQP